MLLSIRHVQLSMPAGQEDKARRFYAELLGLQEIEKPTPLRARGGVWFALAGGQQLHIGVEADFRPNKKAHPCFITDHFDEVVRRLIAAGYDVQHDTLIEAVRRCYSTDVFGNRLEFEDVW
jgi:catechol 2,3-dioxygenase-like lactoylglutathione lyase family enzyme